MPDRAPSPPNLASDVNSSPLIATRIEQLSPHRETLFEGESPAVTPTPSQRPPSPTIRGYAVEGVLGMGGMGIVYKAWDIRVNRAVALKMMIGGGYGNSTARVRFQIEAEVVAQLQHPNIVQLYEFGVHEEQPFVALEFVAGGSLSECLKAKGPHSPTDAAALVAKLADAVATAHAKGIIHRDIKPLNILLTPDGEPKITDFGLARIGESDMTVTGALLGTPGYMAPEQAAGRTREVGTPSDVYALGVVLYELTTGRRPFEGPPEQVVLQHILDEPPSLRSLSRNIPWDLQTICLKCLEKEPKKRYSAARLADDLRAFLNGRPISARPVGNLERITKWTRRNPWRAAAVGVCFAVALGALGFAFALERTRAEERRANRAREIVESLTVADTVDVPRLVRQLEGLHDHAEPALLSKISEPVESRSGLHSRLALLAQSPPLAHEIARYGPDCRSDELLTIREMLIPHAEAVAEILWSVLQDESAPVSRRLRAGCLLAGLKPRDARWESVSPVLADTIVRENPLEVITWAAALDPVRVELFPVLLRRYTELRERSHARTWEDRAPAGEEAALDLTASLLARSAADRPHDLAELAMIFEARHFALCHSAIVTHQAKVTPFLRAGLETRPSQDWPSVTAETAFETATAATVGATLALTVAIPEPRTDAAARRRAFAAAVLIKLNAAEDVWVLFRTHPDPSTRVHLIHRLARIGVEPRDLVRQFEIEKDPIARRSLMLALGEYPPATLPTSLRGEMTQRLLAAYSTNPSPAVHSAIGWILRERLGLTAEVAALDKQEVGKEPGSRDWYVTAEGQTMAVVRGPVSFVMGTPAAEQNRGELEEPPHQIAIPRNFAIGTTEVTAEQFLRFKPRHTWTKAYSPDLDGPVPAITWPAAAAYCNWLSKQAGIPEAQWCYEPNTAGEYDTGMRAKVGHLKLTGYRLPTEAEWEYSCRAGTQISRPYGHSVELQTRYAWYFRNSDNRTHPVGRLKPNDLGLFDMLGNVLEWVDDPPHKTNSCRTVDLEAAEGLVYTGRQDRHPRGGAFNYTANMLRSGCRFLNSDDYRQVTVGFRLARTLPPID